MKKVETVLFRYAFSLFSLNTVTDCTLKEGNKFLTLRQLNANNNRKTHMCSLLLSTFCQNYGPAL